MDQRYRRRMAGGDHDEPQSSSENGASDSPLSGEDNRATAATTSSALSPKKGRRSIQKRVVSVRIGDVEGGSRSSSSKGDAYPPSDSWAWRKYGQKPIKGSPYPRGYYRCSSSKGCPARKQVERSRVDPTTLLITYASEHNHPIPAAKHHHSVAAPPAPPTPATPETPSPPEPEPEPEIDDIDTDEAAVAEENIPSEDRKELLACAAELGLGGAVLMDFSWLADVVKEAPSFVGPIWDGVDDVSTLPMSSVNMREEDESLFADLDELPDCLAVFRNRRGTSTCSIRAAAMHT